MKRATIRRDWPYLAIILGTLAFLPLVVVDWNVRPVPAILSVAAWLGLSSAAVIRMRLTSPEVVEPRDPARLSDSSSALPPERVAASAQTAAGSRADAPRIAGHLVIEKIWLASEVMTNIGPQSEMGEIRRTIVEAAQTALESELVALFTIDPYTGDIQCEGAKEVREDLQRPFLDLCRTRLADRSRRNAWTIEIDHREPGSQDAQRILRDRGIQRIVACPVRSQGSARGALVAFFTSNPCPSSEKVAIMEAVAAHASVAISHGLAIEQSRELLEDLAGANEELSFQATSDGLTGLANHRTFQQAVADLCRKSSNSPDRVFSLAMVDVDHFKVYNDTHGHRQGDAVLLKVARALSSGLRQGDVAARYGGEEFAIIFRKTTKDTAFAAADRIRREIARQSYRKGAVTVSVGLAECPTDGTTPGELIEHADKALYHAKITGRNRVFVWGSAGSLASENARSSEADKPPKAVLVIENPAEESAGMIGDMLSEMLCRVEVAASSIEAIELLKTRVFDIALVSRDALPNKDVRSLANLAAIHPHMPIVLIAAELPIPEGREALWRGASDILVKPYNPAELPVVIERNIERRRLELQRMMEKSTGLMLQAIEALVAAIDAKDHFTAGHSERVTWLSLAISQELDISNEERYALELAARLHDIGKLALPDSSLNKRSPLTEEDWDAIRQHPVMGAKIVGTIDELAYVSTIIRHHHERLDGTGYPDGLRGPAIPYLSRIIGVADAYEAMTSERAYRGRLTPTEAFEELYRGSGIHYSPEILEVLKKQLIAQGEIVEIADQQSAA